MRQKIVLVSFLYGEQIGGGAVKVVYDLAQYLAAFAEVIILTTGPTFKTARYTEKNITIYQLGLRNLYWVADKDSQPVWKKAIWQLIDIWNPMVFIQVYKILKVEQPDIVHTHKLRGLSPSVWTAAKMANVPKIVHTSHDYELISPQGTLSGRVGRWIEENRWFLRPYTWIRSWFSKVVNIATAPSQYTLDKIKARGFFGNAQMLVIPNTSGYTVNELSRISNQVSARSKTDAIFRVLYLGRLAPDKGVDLLCEAFLIVHKRHADIHLDIAGYGPLEADLKEKYGHYPNIVFHGGVFGPEKETLLARCDVFVLPSTWQEVFGIVIIEAYTHGKPVIAASVGGVPELIQEGKTGFLVPPGDVSALADILEKLCAEPAKLHSMIEHCLAMASNYAVESVQQQYQTIYR